MRKLVLSLAILAIMVPLLAQPKLTVVTDSSFYEPGSEVTVIVNGPPRAPVGLEVRGPKGELIALKQLALDARGNVKFTFLLDPHCAEGVYTVYVAVPGATASTTFEVVVRPTPIILLAPPGQAGVGERSEILCFVYPGLQVNLLVYARQAGGEWTLLGRYESNSSGWLVLPITPPSEGVYEVKVEFAGTPEYGPASATASFRAVRAPPQWKIDSPPQKWLGETLTINCTGYEYVVARTVAGDRRYKCGERVRLDTAGPIFLYPGKGDALGTPSVTMVKAKLNATVQAPPEVGVNEPFTLAAHLAPPAPAVRVSFVDARGTVLAEALSRMNGTAFARVSLGKVGDLIVRAIPHQTSVFEVGDCPPATIRVLGERVYVRVTILDAAGRRLYNSVVEIAGRRYEAPMGVAEVTVRAGEYDVKVHWRGLTVYSGRVRLEEHNVTLTVPLYDLRVKVVDFLGRPAAGELVELYNDTQRIAVGTTGDEGELTIIRLPPGVYTVRVGDTAKTVSVPQESEVRIVLSPSIWMLALAALIAAVALLAAIHSIYTRNKRKRKH